MIASLKAAIEKRTTVSRESRNLVALLTIKSSECKEKWWEFRQVPRPAAVGLFKLISNRDCSSIFYWEV